MGRIERLEGERAKVVIALADVDVLRLTVPEIRRLCGVSLSRQVVTTIKHQYLQAREGKVMSGKAGKNGEGKVEQIGQQMVLERIANVISKSYVHLGDNEKVASEDALTMIKRHLLAYDPSIITRNEKRALPKTAPVIPDNKLEIR